MSALVFHEEFGDVTRTQLSVYRKHNVSPADHDLLVSVFGADHGAIVRAVREFSGPGGFSGWRFAQSV